MTTNPCRNKRIFLIAHKVVSIITLMFFSAGNVFALPSGQQVVNGQASFITQSNNLTVTNAPNAIINWQGFSINNNEAVRFLQQNSGSSVLNRVTGQDPSRILGLLQSNGKVFLINPNGILFGQGARIDVNGLFASTLAISNQDFLAGKFNFSAGAVAGSIQNQGTITTPTGGKVYLIAPDIENSGIINTPKGEVLLAAGHSVQLVDSLNPDIAVVVSAPENKAVNLGQIVAQSGKVGIYGGLISQKGSINADSAVSEGGRIFLRATKAIELADTSVISADGTKGGQIIAMTAEDGKISGTLTARGAISAQGDGTIGSGGFVETSAAKVDLNGIRVRTNGGNWLIDPFDFTVAASGGDITGAGLSSMLGGGSATSVTIHTETTGTNDFENLYGTAGVNGDIFVNDTVSWSGGTLTLNAYRNIYINSALNGSGTAKLALLYGQGAIASGNTATYSINAPVNLPAGPASPFPNFSTKLGSDGATVNYTVVTSLGVIADATGGAVTLQGMAAWGYTSTAGNFALGSDINASLTSDVSYNGILGFTPIGYGGMAGGDFSGTFDGLGHTITGLNSNRPTSDSNYPVGLFGYTGPYSIIRNVGLVGGNITGALYVGGLVGYGGGTISNSYNTGTVSGDSFIGGLVGQKNLGSIASSWNSGAVTGTSGSSGNYVGGLVGANNGASGNLATISNSYNTGGVTGKGSYIGGLVGANWYGSITGSNSTGTVTGTGTGSTPFSLGGLVGATNNGTISDSYSTGQVIAVNTNNFGGLVGYNQSGTISNSNSSSLVSGTGNYSGGLVGNNNGAITNSYSTGAVSVTGNYGGGLMGYNSSNGTINTSNSTGVVSVTGDYVGGLVGISFNTGAGSIGGSYHSTGLVSGTGNYVGGLVGYGGGISDSWNTGEVSGGAWVGGLVGYNLNALITSSYSTGAVTGTGNYVGGLLGQNSGTGSISGSYHSAGLVSGGIGNWIGGLVGYSDGGISSSYNTSAVSGGTGNYVGGLVGYKNSGDIASSWNEGTVTGSGNYVGGLVGYNSGGSITSSYNKITGAVTGGLCVGGLVGWNTGSITTNSYSLSTVDGTDNVGGLVGWNTATGSITSSYSTGAVTGTGPATTSPPGASVGGLVGDNLGAISSSYSTGLVKGIDYVGGLAGYNSGSITNNSYSTGEVIGTGNWIGGLVGKNDTTGAVSNSYSTGAVTGVNYVGGLVGWNASANTASVTASHHSTGLVSGASWIGGLVGDGQGGISDSYNTATVSGTGNYIGGLVGYSYSSNITNSYNTGAVTGVSSVGGLVGYNSGYFGAISNSYSTGAVSVTGGYGGGLVGLNEASISNSYSTGAVSGTGTGGGLAGYNSGAISDSYSTGTVSGTGTGGGLVGYNYFYSGSPLYSASGSISNSYSTGAVTGTGGGDGGGLVGYNSGGVITSSYWDTDTSGWSTSAGGTGLTTAQMMTQASYSGWNFSSPWNIVESISYPYLAWQYSGTPQIISGKVDVTGAGKTIQTAVNGSLLATAATGANGFYYFALPGNSVASGSTFLAYISGNTVKSASIYLSSGTHITDLSLNSNTVTASGATMSNTTFGNAKEYLTSPDIPYTFSGNNLTLTSGFNLAMNADGDITLNGLVDAGAGNVTLKSGGAIVNGMGGAISIIAASLAAEAVSGIGSGDPLMTKVNMLAALNTTSNNIQIDNTGILTVTALSNGGSGDVILQNIGAITTDISTVTSSGGSVSITAHSPLTIGAGGVSAYSSISLVAAPSAGGADNLTINGAIASSNGSIILSAGNSLVVGPGGSLSAPNGTVTLNGATTVTDDLATVGNNTATDNTVSSLITTVGTITSDESGDDEEERKKKSQEGGDQKTDEKKLDDDKKYCN